MSTNEGKLAAGAAALLSLALGSLQSVVWNGSDAPRWTRAVAAWFEPSLLSGEPASAMLQPDARYFAHGRFSVAIYLLLFVAGAALRRALPAWARRCVLVAGVVALLGDVLSYGLSERAGPWLRRIGFWYLELPALALVALAFTAVGIGALRRGDGTARFVVAAPAAAAGTALLHYLPHGILLGLAAALLSVAARSRTLSHEEP